jgi:hypothetical protein
VIDFTDRRIDRVDLLQMQAQQEAVMPGDAAAQRFPQRFARRLDPTMGQFGQTIGIALASDQGFDPSRPRPRSCSPCRISLPARAAPTSPMEATGVYWKPVWHVLSDGDFTLLLANAAHVKNVPGRKTDVNDATWLDDLSPDRTGP